MAGKVRVHELARELGVTSKEVLGRLAVQGVFVKSASSVVAAPAARRLRAAHARTGPHHSQRRIRSTRQAASSGRKRHSDVADRKARPQKRLTRSQLARIHEEYRNAYASQNPSDAINKVFLKYEALYEISRATISNTLAADRKRHPGVYAALRQLRNQRQYARRQQRQRQPRGTKPPEASVRQQSALPPPDVKVDGSTRPRNRLGSLPTVAGAMKVHAITDVIFSEQASDYERDTVVDCLKTFSTSGKDGYGYLAWRYAWVHRRQCSDVPSRTVEDDLAAIAHVVDTEKQLLEQMISDYGAFLEHPALAVRAMERELRDLLDPEDIGRSAADELRRVRADSRFLRRALVLTIASPACDERLWEMLGRIRPPTRSNLVEITPPLMTAVERLNDEIAAVESLLTIDKAALSRFFQRSGSELVALRLGRFDFLVPFREIGSSPSTGPRQLFRDLPFAVLPEGEQLRNFLKGLRSSGLYRGYQIDVQRLNVLEDLEEYFGASRCAWYEGSESSTGVNNQYLVLAIRSTMGPAENAVAISPLTGQHATYVVRDECAEGHWVSIFSNPKLEARLHGARRLLFTTPDRRTDKYTAMREKIVTLLECDPRDFHNPLIFDGNSGRYRLA